MYYTVRFAHLKEKPDLSIGAIIKNDYFLGTVGNTGQSTNDHLHIDVAKGKYQYVYHQKDFEEGTIVPCPRELNYFIDRRLFGNIDFWVTTYYADYRYMTRYGKVHYGYDLVPKEGKRKIYWNRSFNGEVLYNDFHSGYGNLLMVGYEK